MAEKLEDFTRHRESSRRTTAPRDQARRVRRECPICGGPAAARYRPFCSARCADIDLARWLNENYRVPGETSERQMEPDDADPTDK
jgi:endogenous inhibitor of DNA gyrase (YacG/DUF329 family)